MTLRFTLRQLEYFVAVGEAGSNGDHVRLKFATVSRLSNENWALPGSIRRRLVANGARSVTPVSTVVPGAVPVWLCCAWTLAPKANPPHSKTPPAWVVMREVMGG